MTANASPTKQRAALAPLDANAKPSLPSPKMLKAGSISVIPSTGGTSPLKKVMPPAGTKGTKRSADDACSPGNKKPCLEEEDTSRPQRSRTSSPSSSSIFDNSTAEGDASWATTTTEPDIVGAIVTDAPALLAPRQRGSMTREQAREKAEILRLRLGLASYKLRTGQTGVPLADLQHKPLPPRPSNLVQQQSPARNSQTASSHTSRHSSQQSHSVSSTSMTDPASKTTIPQKGVAASGLLSLSSASPSA